MHQFALTVSGRAACSLLASGLAGLLPRSVTSDADSRTGSPKKDCQSCGLSLEKAGLLGHSDGSFKVLPGLYGMVVFGGLDGGLQGGFQRVGQFVLLVV